MHAIIAFGKDMVNTIEDYVITKKTIDPNIAERVRSWMKAHHINVYIR
jgi:hypothetical protein